MKEQSARREYNRRHESNGGRDSKISTVPGPTVYARFTFNE